MTEEILGAMNRQDDATAIERVWRQLRIELRQIATWLSVSELRAKTTLDFSSSAYSTGMLLPSDLLGIDMVRDEDEYEFWERNRSAIQNDEYGNRFYRYHPSTTGLLTGTDVSVTNEGTAFTSDTLDAWLAADATRSVIGEYVRFGAGMEYYLISTDTSPYTIAPTYYGPTRIEEDFVIRPPETQRMVILDAGENVLQDRDIDVYYWKSPPGIYRPSDRIPLASCEYLKLRILRAMPEAKERRPVNQREISEAKADLKKANPSFPRTQSPRDKHNNLFSFNTNMYTDRGD